MKFLIVTPSYNSERFIRETIESVITQEGDFEIALRVMDGGSTDGTLDILREYSRLFDSGKVGVRCKGIDFGWVSEKDSGMYDAINRGFAKSDGDILAWINADDLYRPGAFDIIARVFGRFPEIRWLKGITSYIDADSKFREKGECYLYDRDLLAKGVYGRDAYFVQQDSVFWLSKLWAEAGPIPSELKRAGDYALWVQFARKAKLFSLDREVSCFRKVPGQLSEDFVRYRSECEKVSPRAQNQNRAFRYFMRIEKRLPEFLAREIFSRLFSDLDLSVVIEADRKGFEIRKSRYFKT
jgi:glycosyltransferase involved in cell wall biosynthesis